MPNDGELIMPWLHGVFTWFLLIVFSTCAQSGTVVIDPGHGGVDPGAIGIAGQREKHMTLLFSQALKQELATICPNLKVVLSRNSDLKLSLQARVAFIESHSPDFFLSVHMDAFHDSSVSGLTLFYGDHKQQSSAEPLGFSSKNNQTRVEWLLQTLINHQRPVNSRWLAISIINRLDLNLRHDSLPHLDDLRVLRAKVPGVLLEIGYLSNHHDTERIKNPRSRRRLARQVAEGLVDYWQELQGGSSNAKIQCTHQ